MISSTRCNLSRFGSQKLISRGRARQNVHVLPNLASPDEDCLETGIDVFRFPM
ncbi:hypothetical protein Mapa_017325 [Marchantia paleacea]|nr:hypothetical protein Mapa_017325 [Marchantia paleacea]